LRVSTCFIKETG